METQTRFDLNTAVAAWRQELAGQPGVTLEQARELETHLAESMEDLKRRGLQEEEAFWVARRRLGPCAQIADEFVKAEPSRVWRERVYWMAVGVLGGHVLLAAFGLGMNTVTNLLARSGFSINRWVGIGLVSLVAYCALAWFALRLAQGRILKPIQLLLNRLTSDRRLAWGLCIVVLLLTASGLTSMWFYAHSNPAALGAGRIDIWLSVLLNTAWPALMAFLVFRLAPRKATDRGRLTTDS